MRNIMSVVVAAGLLLSAVVAANAASITFVPSDSDIGDLDHSYYYSWGINYTVPEGQQIEAVSLTIKQINNWQNETNVLYIHLLDNPSLALRSYTDNEGGGDNWSGKGPLLCSYVDHNASRPEDLTIDLGSVGALDTFKTYVTNGRFGFGFDPDCHYYNCGISCTISMKDRTKVPEPSSLLSLIAAVGGLPLLRLRKRRAA